MKYDDETCTTCRHEGGFKCKHEDETVREAPVSMCVNNSYFYWEPKSDKNNDKPPGKCYDTICSCGRKDDIIKNHVSNLGIVKDRCPTCINLNGNASEYKLKQMKKDGVI